MAQWTEYVAANNWVDQFVRNGGQVERASYDYMNDSRLSFRWEHTREGWEVWNSRFRYLNGVRIMKDLHR